MTRKELKDEIKIRDLVIIKLDKDIASLKKTATRKRSKKRAKFEELAGYKSYTEAQDAYGWGFITEEEFDRAAAILERSDREAEKPGIEDRAAGMLLDIRKKFYEEIYAFNRALYTPEELSRRMKEQHRKEFERKRKKSASTDIFES